VIISFVFEDSVSQVIETYPQGFMTTSSSEITALLVDWSNGDQAALEKLLPLVERELRRIAHSYMRRENPDHTLQTTALVNEAYLRLIDQKRTRWQNRAHFFGIAARIMRRILVNYARDQHRAKRGGKAVQISLSEVSVVSFQRTEELIVLDEALHRLAAVDERKSQVVELRYFGGLDVQETAEVLKVSTVTVMRDWKFAKAWLLRELGHAA
jgi:RNA polymerase sigma factor (TIGR02999 family)